MWEFIYFGNVSTVIYSYFGRIVQVINKASRDSLILWTKLITDILGFNPCSKSCVVRDPKTKQRAQVINTINMDFNRIRDLKEAWNSIYLCHLRRKHLYSPHVYCVNQALMMTLEFLIKCPFDRIRSRHSKSLRKLGFDCDYELHSVISRSTGLSKCTTLPLAVL